jgi:alpha-tubulin suppressor-like RCC1 family protein
MGSAASPSSFANVSAISAGHGHSLALKGGGSVVALGCNSYVQRGQCGVPSGGLFEGAG